MNTFTLIRVASIRSALAASLLFVGLGAGQVRADGNGAVGVPSIPIEHGTHVVSAGTGLDLGSGDIHLNVPAGSTVKQVLLYWSAKGATPLRNTLRVNGTTVTGASIGLDGVPNPALKSRSYRADITGLGLVVSGANTVKVEGVGIPDHVLDGASLVVILDASTDVQYSGRSVAVEATIAGIKTRLGDTGELPFTGGALIPKPVLGANVPNLLFSNTVSSSTIGAGGATVSKTSAEGLGLGLLSTLLGLELLESSAVAQCTVTGAQVIGGSKVLGLTLNNNETKVALAPNTVLLDLGIIKIIANEQIKAGSGNEGFIKVNGLHISAPLLGALGLATDVVVASASAGVHCFPQIPSDIKVLDGTDFAFQPTSGTKYTTKKRTFTFASRPFDRVAQLHLLVGDAEPAKPDAVLIYRNNVLIKTLKNTLDSSDGFEWDDDIVTIPLPAGSTSVGVRLVSKSAKGLTDSIVWVAAILNMPTEAPANVYSGRATVIRADVLGILSVALADTGALPGVGGGLDATVVDASIPLLPLLSKTAKAVTIGAGEQSLSTASVEDLSLGLLSFGIGVDADILKSYAMATCSADNKASVSGDSTIAKLALNGNPITNLKANTVINLGLAKIFINEKIATVSGNYGAITVNGLRILVPDLLGGLLSADLANVIVAQSHADILCR